MNETYIKRMSKVRKRNRQQTMARILQAVGEVIAERGAEQAGINAVANKAGVNKVLIYRYFGGWEGLIEHYLAEGHFLTTYTDQFLAEKVQTGTYPPDQIWANYLIGLLRELKVRQSTQQLLKWEISNPTSPLSQRLTAIRNESYRKVISQFSENQKYDGTAVMAILLAGITLMSLLGPYHDKLVELNLQTGEDWHRVEDSIQQIFNALNASAAPVGP